MRVTFFDSPGKTQISLSRRTIRDGPLGVNSTIGADCHLRKDRGAGIENNLTRGGPEKLVVRIPAHIVEIVTYGFLVHERAAFRAIVSVWIMDRPYHERLVQRVVRSGDDALDRVRRNRGEHQPLLNDRIGDAPGARCERQAKDQNNRQSVFHFDRLIVSSPGGAGLLRPEMRLYYKQSILTATREG